MTRNDTFFKILFAIEIALLPLVMASYILMPTWSVGLFVAAVLIVKIWLELFKNKEDKAHNIIMAIGNTLVVSSLVIFFTVNSLINVAMCVAVVILTVLMNLLKAFMNDTVMPEMISAVDTCYMLFECLLLVGLTFIIFSSLISNIALFALLLTAGVSVAYKLYHLVRYNDVIGRTKTFFANLFAKIFRRK
ncbi:MAG: hypothetical protein J6Q13_00430 [Clostridia bacterium]|nr:hypothetical protein [Clostridia bacterium]